MMTKEYVKMSKSDKAFFLMWFYLVITVPALTIFIGYEYRFSNLSLWSMLITAVLIILPNVYFIRKAVLAKPDEAYPANKHPSDRHPKLTITGILLSALSLATPVCSLDVFFTEDGYEKTILSKTEYSYYLLNKYSPDVLEEMEKLNNKQLMTVQNIITSIPDASDSRGVSLKKTRKIREGIELYCSSKLSTISDEEYERLQTSLYDEKLKKTLKNLQGVNETSISNQNNNIQIFADIFQKARDID